MVGVVGYVLEWVVGLCQAVELVFVIIMVVAINVIVIVVILFDCRL